MVFFTVQLLRKWTLMMTQWIHKLNWLIIQLLLSFLVLWKVFCAFSLHSWQRGPNPPNLWKTPYIAYPSLFSSFVQPPPPFLSLPTLDPTALFVALFLVLFWLNGWSLHIWVAILLNDIMDIHISSLGTFVPEGRWCVFYATRRQVCWGLTHNKILCWYSDLISHTQTHTRTETQHTQRPVTTRPYKYIITPIVVCSQQPSLLHWMNNSLISKIYFPQCLFFSKTIHL